ncbi:hypothetical protein EVAR_53180_1 [Eumeta japonica]|uniref:Uncharacterized protein n=1 Tax=Eumeta variegata TaxID=151549 RepID=A0A4C1YXR4_EUMVA|nr:hypothetical protein EVAR_53180_1 [Eumeta japonica]
MRLRTKATKLMDAFKRAPSAARAVGRALAVKTNNLQFSNNLTRFPGSTAPRDGDRRAARGGRAEAARPAPARPRGDRCPV